MGAVYGRPAEAELREARESLAQLKSTNDSLHLQNETLTQQVSHLQKTLQQREAEILARRKTLEPLRRQVVICCATALSLFYACEYIFGHFGQLELIAIVFATIYIIGARPTIKKQAPALAPIAGTKLITDPGSSVGAATAFDSLGSEPELKVLAEVRQVLHQKMNGKTNEYYPRDDEPLLNVQLLRFVREHGLNVNKVVKCYMAALDWKKKNLPAVPEGPDGGWLPATAMPHGILAAKYAQIGIFCGYSKKGNPVKIERLGVLDVDGLSAGGKPVIKKFNTFYLGLIEFLQRQLDQMSLRDQRLQGTYEIFDMKGLGTQMLSMTVLFFVKDVLGAFSTHYPQSFRKAVVINSPAFMFNFWNIVSTVLPQSVKDKVNILGTDYEDTLKNDLTDEALAWVSCASGDLNYAPGEVPSAASSGS